MPKESRGRKTATRMLSAKIIINLFFLFSTNALLAQPCPDAGIKAYSKIVTAGTSPDSSSSLPQPMKTYFIYIMISEKKTLVISDVWIKGIKQVFSLQATNSRKADVGISRLSGKKIELKAEQGKTIWVLEILWSCSSNKRMPSTNNKVSDILLLRLICNKKAIYKSLPATELSTADVL